MKAMVRLAVVMASMLQARLRPTVAQNPASSGVQVARAGCAARSMRRMAACIHTSDMATTRNRSMKQLVHTPTMSFIAPKVIGRMNPPSPPIRPTTPPTLPTRPG
jgi:hypothetical protein